MLGITGAAILVAKLLGFAIVIVTLLTALLYHLGWRNDHPDGFWPLRSLLGFGGVLLAGTGLIIGSLFFIIIGISAYFCGLAFGGSKAAAPPPAA
jgi:hypothetical protein